MKKVLALISAGLLASAAIVSTAEKARADFEEPPPKPGSSSSGPKGKSKFSGGAYFGVAVACSAISLIGNAVYIGGRFHRQLTPNEALSKILGCFVPGLGYVFMAFNPNTPAALYHARIAWLWEQIPWVRERLWMERHSGGFTYPSLQQMLRDLRAAGFRV